MRGVAVVDLDNNTVFNRRVALKRVAAVYRGNERYRRRLAREAERASALPATNIAAVYDLLEDAGELFVVMEYVDGLTLRQRMLAPTDLESFFPIAEQCAEALAI